MVLLKIINYFVKKYLTFINEADEIPEGVGDKKIPAIKKALKKIKKEPYKPKVGDFIYYQQKTNAFVQWKNNKIQTPEKKGSGQFQ
jgi:hypothetical protein